MAINMNQFIGLLVPTVQSDQITTLIRNYILLKYRLAHPEKEEFYFRAAKESNTKKLEGYKENYEKHRAVLNKLSYDRILELIDEKEKEYLVLLKRNIYPLFSRGISLNFKQSEISTLKNYLLAKSKFGILLPIDDYEGNDTFMEKILECEAGRRIVRSCL